MTASEASPVSPTLSALSSARSMPEQLPRTMASKPKMAARVATRTLCSTLTRIQPAIPVGKKFYHETSALSEANPTPASVTPIMANAGQALELDQQRRWLLHITAPVAAAECRE